MRAVPPTAFALAASKGFRADDPSFPYHRIGRFIMRSRNICRRGDICDYDIGSTGRIGSTAHVR